MADIMKMKQPSIGKEMKQGLPAANWVRASIPDYDRIVKNLHELMDNKFKNAGQPKKKVV